MPPRKSLLGGFLSLAVLAVTFLPQTPAAAAPAFRALIFSETAGYRHASIPDGLVMFSQLASANNFEIVTSESSAAMFTPANLATFDVLVMFQTSGMVFDNDAQRQAVQGFLRSGKGIVAIHNATDMGIDTTFPWWDNTINAGAHMPAHSAGLQQATAKVADKAHPSTAGLPDNWVRTEEWYNFDKNIRGDAHVLVTVDERTYTPGSSAMGIDHPISWCRNAEGGKVWATAMGHDSAAYSEAHFRAHILGGVKWAAGNAAGECGGTVWNNFQKIPLDENTVDPFDLQVAPDGRVFYIQRAGALKIYKPSTQQIVTAGTLSVYTGGEQGLMGIALDPAFSTNNWVYLYWAPASSTTDINRLSRFTMNGDLLDLSSEKVLLEVPDYRSRTYPEPGHTGGHIAFGPGGNLYLSTGDDTPPNLSTHWQGYAPLDWRPGQSFLDSARTSGNTNDLRGKILRIHPEVGGTYTIPSGNLFAPGTARTRPEIYAMGFRNPFRFEVDQQTGWINLADYGPDRTGATTNRGPTGLVELNVIKQAGNFGWPFCHGNNQPYAPYNPDTGVVGPKFNCNAPVNDSPNNTGLRTLPPLVQPQIWYPTGTSAEFPEMGTGGQGPMGGPVYRYNAASTSPSKFPAYYNGVHFYYEWMRNYIKEIHFDGNGNLVKINSFLPNLSFKKPMAMRFGPDGSLYVIEWGTSFGGGNSDSGLYRIDYVRGNRAPVAKASATPTNGITPLTVAFSSTGSNDPDPSDTVTYAWDFDGNGTTDSTAANPSFTYNTNGNYAARLTVRDSGGLTNSATVPITVGNRAPTVTIAGPPNGGMLDFGQDVAYTINVTDPEDGTTINCGRVLLNPALGHDDHEHGTTDMAGCSGTVATSILGGHPDGANLFYAFNARYTDNGNGTVAPLTGYAKAILQPKHKQAEYFTAQSGIRVVGQAGAESGNRIGDISNNDWIMFSPMSLQGINSVSYRVSSPNGGASIELRAGSPTGQLLATAAVPNTGGWNNYQQLPAVPVSALSGTHNLYMVFKSSLNNSFDLDSFTFGGAGVGTTPTGIAGKTYTLTAQHSSKLADVNGASTADGATVLQWAPTGGNNQKWQAIDAGGGYVYLKAVHSGKCLDVTGASTADGAAIVQLTCNNQNNQKWQAIPTATTGVYTLKPVHSGKCLDVTGASTADGAALIQWTCHSNPNQQWRLTVTS